MQPHASAQTQIEPARVGERLAGLGAVVVFLICAKAILTHEIGCRYSDCPEEQHNAFTIYTLLSIGPTQQGFFFFGADPLC